MTTAIKNYQPNVKYPTFTPSPISTLLTPLNSHTEDDYNALLAEKNVLNAQLNRYKFIEEWKEALYNNKNLDVSTPYKRAKIVLIAIFEIIMSDTLEPITPRVIYSGQIEDRCTFNRNLVSLYAEMWRFWGIIDRKTTLKDAGGDSTQRETYYSFTEEGLKLLKTRDFKPKPLPESVKPVSGRCRKCGEEEMRLVELGRKQKETPKTITVNALDIETELETIKVCSCCGNEGKKKTTMRRRTKIIKDEGLQRGDATPQEENLALRKAKTPYIEPLQHGDATPQEETEENDGWVNTYNDPALVAQMNQRATESNLWRLQRGDATPQEENLGGGCNVAMQPPQNEEETANESATNYIVNPLHKSDSGPESEKQIAPPHDEDSQPVIIAGISAFYPSQREIDTVIDRLIDQNGGDHYAVLYALDDYAPMYCERYEARRRSEVL